MSRFKLHRALSQRGIPSQVITTSLLLSLLSNICTTVAAETSQLQSVTPQQATPAEQTVAGQLLGQWQTKDTVSKQVVKFIFTPEGKLFFVMPAPNGRAVALEMAYKINTATQPMQIDVKASPNETAFTIFELTSDRKLRLELAGVSPNQPRPAKFSSKASLFEKVSNATTIPKDVQLLQMEQKTQRPSQNVAIQYINILNKAQQDFYQKNGKYAANMDELGIVTSAETELYRYQIVPQANNTESVMITAQAKTSQIPSYTSAVFTSRNNGKTFTIVGICESDRPSTTPPAMPKAPINGSAQIQCPTGSHLFKSGAEKN